MWFTDDRPGTQKRQQKRWIFPTGLICLSSNIFMHNFTKSFFCLIFHFKIAFSIINCHLNISKKCNIVQVSFSNDFSPASYHRFDKWNFCQFIVLKNDKFKNMMAMRNISIVISETKVILHFKKVSGHADDIYKELYRYDNASCRQKFMDGLVV